MIKINDLHKKFGKLKVLNGISLEINKSGVFTILGPNGSGKTTLIKSILGMVIPSKGTIYFDGIDIKDNWNYRHKIDYLPQIANFPSNLSVIELIEMIKKLRNTKTSDKELIEKFNLTQHLNKKLSNLSGGTRQKVNLVLTFMFDSPLLILDEPTTGLDPISLIHLKELIDKAKKTNKTILVTSHIMSFVEEISDEIVFLLDGNIYFKGKISELKEKTKNDNFEYAIASILNKNYV